MDLDNPRLTRDISTTTTASIRSVSSDPSHRSSVFNDGSDDGDRPLGITNAPKQTIRKSRSDSLDSLPQYQRPSSAPILLQREYEENARKLSQDSSSFERK